MLAKLKNMLQKPPPTTPEHPTPFGANLDWIAFRAPDPEAVIAALQQHAQRLQKTTAAPCSWSHGIKKAYAGHCFVTPAIDGWVLAPGYRPEDSLDSLLIALSSTLDGRVCHFGSQRGVSYVGYALAEKGELQRMYGHVDGVTKWNIGNPTADETALKFRYFEELSEDTSAEEEDAIFSSMPGEQQVHALAARWSVDPGAADWSSRAPGVGWLLR
ncbi:MAG: hypothetical protein ACI8RZ_003420 [Myxococcota bacterium]|jgi:hypothetical protein